MKTEWCPINYFTIDYAGFGQVSMIYVSKDSGSNFCKLGRWFDYSWENISENNQVFRIIDGSAMRELYRVRSNQYMQIKEQLNVTYSFMNYKYNNRI